MERFRGKRSKREENKSSFRRFSEVTVDVSEIRGEKEGEVHEGQRGNGGKRGQCVRIQEGGDCRPECPHE